MFLIKPNYWGFVGQIIIRIEQSVKSGMRLGLLHISGDFSITTVRTSNPTILSLVGMKQMHVVWSIAEFAPPPGYVFCKHL
jgi:hypothetical protein